MTLTPDPSLLRKAVRLVHCLQKERGASCAYNVSPALFEAQILHARQQTDTAVKLWLRSDNTELPVAHALSKVRLHVDREYGEEKVDDGAELGMDEYHRILLAFNGLISAMLYTFLFPSAKQSHTADSKMVKRKQHRRKRSLGAVFTSLDMEIPASLVVDAVDDSPERKGVSFAQETSRVPDLLNLLECFVRLKESTGLERALLSSMFAMGQVDHRLMNDLVLEVENQYKLITELQLLRELDANLLHLIRENVGLPAPMERLQSFILSEFDLEGFEQDMDPENVWNLITVYMDKLHALELSIVEEVECAMHESEDLPLEPALVAGNQQDPLEVLNQIFSLNGSIQDGIEQMPADLVKSKLTEFMASAVLDDMASRDPSAHASPPPADGALIMDDSIPPPSEWDINLYEIHFSKRIGRGTAGTTYLAKWSGQEVAVKVAAITEMGMGGWHTEVKSLRKLHHPNIIRLLGSVYNESPLTYCLVLEYCNGGDLQEALQKASHGNFFFNVAKDVAHGMNYLHSRGIIHRDIKPANVLLDGDVSTGNIRARVTDFGVAALEHKSDMTSETGTYRWMAPEVIRHQPYSEKADCYSYGVVLWQVVTREDPFPKHSSLEAAGKVALELARPKFPTGIPSQIKTLIQNCWAEDPESRYSFADISRKLGEGFDLDAEDTRWMAAPLGHPAYNGDDDEGANIIDEEKTQHIDPAAFLAEAQKPKGLKNKLLGAKKSLIRRVSRDYL